MSCEFKDSAGRQWRVEINSWSIKAVKLATGVDLGKLLDDKMRPYLDLVTDWSRIVDVIWVLVRDQDKTGLTDEQFGCSLGGDTLEAAVAAFEEAFILFCPSHLRKILLAARTKGQVAMEKLTELEMKAIESELPQTSSTSASNSPELPESIPDPSVSAN